MMNTNSIYKTFLLAAVLLLAATSCVKDTLYDTPHTDTGTDTDTGTGTCKVTITADWSGRGEGVDIPESWTVTMGDYTGTETGETHAPDYLFTPGSYQLAAYNTPDGITITGTTATVAEDADNAGRVSGTPGWLFTSVQEVEIEGDTAHSLTAVMRQQARGLTLVIEPTGDTADRIESIEGCLSGVAGSLDFSTDTHGTPSDVALAFTKIIEGTDAGKWSVTVRLLGIAGSAQALTATIAYADSNPQDTTLESDLTAALADFNADKTVPLTLSGNFVETSDEADFTATIIDWETVGNEQVDLQ